MKSSSSLYQTFLAALLFALALCSIHAVAAPGASAIGSAPQGTLVIIGGGLRADNAEVWQRIVKLSGGPGARIAVLASAAMNPEKSGESIIKKLNQYGADAFFVPLAVKLPNRDYRKAAEDPAIVTQIKSATGIYFAGGDQG
ncbi:MAG: cyanophycinase, partial [Janthinobacterium lividum]|nr:cyanophycinase [Janthinobacterium lividum]